MSGAPPRPAETLWRWGLLLVVSLACALLSVDLGGRLDEALEVGQVATTNIETPIRFQWVDEASTRVRQEEAVRSTPVVYDYDATLASRLQGRVSTAFDLGRRWTTEAALQARSEGRSGTTAEERATIALDFVAHLSVTLRPEELETLAAAEFSASIESLTNELIGVAMGGYVVHEAVDLPPPQQAVMVLRSLSDRQDETLLSDRAQVRTLEDARQAISLYTLDHEGDRPEGHLRIAAAIARAQVRANFTYNELLTQSRRAQAKAEVQPVQVVMERGALVIRDGDVVTAQHVALLEQLKAELGERSRGRAVGSVLVFTGILLLAVYSFAKDSFRRFTRSRRDLAATGVLLVLTVALCRISVELSDPIASVMGTGMQDRSLWYMTPVAGAVLLVRILVNAESSMVFAGVAALLAGVVMDQEVVMSAYFLVSSVSAAWAIGRNRERRVMLRAGLVAGLVNTAFVLAIGLVDLNLLGQQTVGSIPWSLAFAFAGGLLSGFLVLAVVPLFELAGFVTDLQLLELANLDHPLMRNLMLRAPGSYHHSVMVGALAEAAAEAVGANALQARVCAYFHDIGKAVRPQYFVENQTDGINRHERLTPYQSAQVIIDHVRDGGTIAKQHKLPRPIIDNIYMHHGDGLVPYFFRRARETDPEVDPADFRYPGPKPNTREAGIIMLADKIEAACRSIKHPTPENVSEMIQKIINSVMAEGQFRDCPLTLKELYTIAETFKTTVLAIHHHRIAYPDRPLPTARRVEPDSAQLPRDAVITLEIPASELASSLGSNPPPEPIPPGALRREDDSTEVVDYESPEYLPQTSVEDVMQARPK